MKFLKANMMRDTAERSNVWSNTNTARHGFTQANGFAAGTMVATAMGWRAAETLQVGDMVLSFDNDMQKITRVERTRFKMDHALPRHLTPLHVPAGAIGNLTEMTLLPEQTVMVESDLSEAMFGDAFVSMPAAALEGFNGIERRGRDVALDVIVLYFEEDQVIIVNHGALVHCAAASSTTLNGMLDAKKSTYDVLPLRTAVEFVCDMALDEGLELPHVGAWATTRSHTPAWAIA